MKRPSQNQRILDYLRSGQRITGLDALQRFGCIRMARVAGDLEAAGEDVRRRWIKTSSGKRVKEYWIQQAPQGDLFGNPNRGRPE
jgi:hypothetical protein